VRGAPRTERSPARQCRGGARQGTRSAGATLAGGAALERATLVLGQATPHAGVLVDLHGPAQAGVDDLAAMARGPPLFDLDESGAGVPDREEQLRVLVQACSAVAPVHQCSIRILAALVPGQDVRVPGQWKKGKRSAAD